MAHKNDLISFLRHYGPISAGDNMYDELIHTEIKRHGITPSIEIEPLRLKEIKENFESPRPRSVILTGTAGDGKTYHCRRVWTHFQGDLEEWMVGNKVASLRLPESGKLLIIVKDLSELTEAEKKPLFVDLTESVLNKDHENVYLVAANDGQLLASWRDWCESRDGAVYEGFKTVESMLVEGRIENDALNLYLYNLSRLDASENFQELAEQVVEHPQWRLCQGCELLGDDGSTQCPIRVNRERLRIGTDGSIFRKRLGELMKLAQANRMHLPIRDVLLLLVNVLLGDRQTGQTLLTCRTAKRRAREGQYRLTNPYANVFGMNLPSDRQRQQYQVFTILEAFGIGRETDNRFDNLLIYHPYTHSDEYDGLVPEDPYYGSSAYEPYLRDYLEGERENIDDFLQALSRQRQRLFFSLQPNEALDPWRLTVFHASGEFLGFVENLESRSGVSRTIETLVRGLNRTFCGMMIEDGTKLYLASSGGDGRGRIASLLNHELSTQRHRRDPYISFSISEDLSTPCLQVLDPARDSPKVIDSIDLQLTHFEYLIRVGHGSLPASFSRQCYEDFLDFKLRLISKMDDLLGGTTLEDEVTMQALTVDDQGRVLPETITVRVDA